MFRADLLGSAEASWEELFAGYTALKAITFSTSVELIMRMADRLVDMMPGALLSEQHWAQAGALARLRGLGVFSMPRPLPINGLAGKVCTTAGGWGRWLWRSAVVAVVATGA